MKPRKMGLFTIVTRSLRQHFVSTSITAFSVALAAGLVMAVFGIQRQTEEAFTGGKVGFDAVLGARGSALQLVLNTVFHLETSPGNIPYSMFQAIGRDSGVALAIPYAVGDNYEGFRIVGTSAEMFTKFEYREGQKLQPAAGGRVFDPAAREALVGSFVAQRTGLQLGSKFNPYHGLNFDETKRHEDEYTVVGILEATNSPSDRVIWIPIDGIFRMKGHVLRGTGRTYRPEEGAEIADEHKEVSAVMLKLKDPQAGFFLDQQINKQGKAATLAWPIGRTMADLFEKLGWMNRVLILVAYLVVLVSAGSILASLYNTMNERRRDFAIMRALGASRRTVFSVIVLEAVSIASLGAFLGWFVYAAILGSARAVIRTQTGVVLDAYRVDPVLILAPLAIILIGSLAGVVPAIKAYRTGVAENLMPQS
jgi:putative ABC transport system permease protein